MLDGQWRHVVEFHLDSRALLLFALLLMLERREVLVPSVIGSEEEIKQLDCLAAVLSLHWHLLEEGFRLHMLLREVAVDDR